MITQSILLALTLSTSPDSVAPPSDQICTTTTPTPPTRIDAQPFSSTAADGTQTWGATATYQSSSGELGDAFMVVDANGTGEVQLMIDGEIISHVAVSLDPTGQPVTTTWHPPDVSASPEAIAEMMQIDLPAIVAESLPQEFKCSPWGRKVMKAGRYMVGAGLAASAAACCSLTATLACAACAAGAWVSNEVAGEFANGYCD